jgi:hypothetical protein
MNQLSWSLTDEVAPFFDNPFIATLCHLIDEKNRYRVQVQRPKTTSTGIH